MDTNKIYSLLTEKIQDESWNSVLAEASRPVIRRRDVSDGRGSRCQLIALCAGQVLMLQVLEWCYMTGNHLGYYRRSHILHANTLPSVSAFRLTKSRRYFYSWSDDTCNLIRFASKPPSLLLFLIFLLYFFLFLRVSVSLHSFSNFIIPLSSSWTIFFFPFLYYFNVSLYSCLTLFPSLYLVSLFFCISYRLNCSNLCYRQ